MWPLRIHLRRQGLEGRAQGQDIAVKVIPKDKVRHSSSCHCHALSFSTCLQKCLCHSVSCCLCSVAYSAFYHFFLYA